MGGGDRCHIGNVAVRSIGRRPHGSRAALAGAILEVLVGLSAVALRVAVLREPATSAREVSVAACVSGTAIRLL